MFNYYFKDELENGDKLIEIISAARGKKSENNLTLKSPIKELNIDIDSKLKNAIEKSIKDLKATLFIENLVLNNCKLNYKINKIELNMDSTN